MNQTIRTFLARAGVMLALSCGSLSASATELLVNGGFETGDLSGWNSSGTVQVLQQWWVQSAYEGDYLAFMPGAATFDAWISQDVDTSTATSATVSFAFSILAAGFYSAYDFIGDRLTMQLGTQTVVDIGLGDVLASSYAEGSTLLDWQVVTVNVDTALLQEKLTINFDLSVESLNNSQYFVAYIDSVSIDAAFSTPNVSNPSTVPEPSVSLLLGGSMLMLGLVRRRRS